MTIEQSAEDPLEASPEGWAVEDLAGGRDLRLIEVGRDEEGNLELVEQDVGHRWLRGKWATSGLRGNGQLLSGIRGRYENQRATPRIDAR